MDIKNLISENWKMVLTLAIIWVVCSAGVFGLLFCVVLTQSPDAILAAFIVLSAMAALPVGIAVLLIYESALKPLGANIKAAKKTWGGMPWKR